MTPGTWPCARCHVIIIICERDSLRSDLSRTDRGSREYRSSSGEGPPVRTAAGGARQQCPTAGARRSLRAMMARRTHKLVYKTSLLRLPASLSGAAGSSSQRQAPSSRAQRHPSPLTWHAQLKIPFLRLKMGQGEHAPASSSPSDRQLTNISS